MKPIACSCALVLLASHAFGQMAEPPALPVPPPPVPSNKEIKVTEPKIEFPKEISLPSIPTPILTGRDSVMDIQHVSGLIELYGNKDNFGVAFAPDRIELMQLTKKKSDGYGPKDFREGRSVALKAGDGDLLRSILTADVTYNWKEDYDCMPAYAFRVKFFQKDKVVSVDLCFLCRTLRTVGNDQELASKNFEFGYDALIKVVERYYPGTMAAVDARTGG